MAQAFTSFIALIILAIFGSGIFTPNAQQNIQELIAAPGKTKHEKPEKNSVAAEVLADIKRQADLFNNFSE